MRNHAAVPQERRTGKSPALNLPAQQAKPRFHILEDSFLLGYIFSKNTEKLCKFRQFSGFSYRGVEKTLFRRGVHVCREARPPCRRKQVGEIKDLGRNIRHEGIRIVEESGYNCV